MAPATKPVIEEMYPLNCNRTEAAVFIEHSRAVASDPNRFASRVALLFSSGGISGDRPYVPTVYVNISCCLAEHLFGIRGVDAARFAGHQFEIVVVPVHRLDVRAAFSLGD